MALIKWTDDLNLNIKSIDDQHRKLVSMINNFYMHLQQKSNKELIGKLIRDMKEYATVHFADEEQLFDRYGFQESAAHKKKHQDFVDKVTDLEDRFNKGKLILSIEITNFLKTWLTEHIKGTDAGYVKLLQSKGAI